MTRDLYPLDVRFPNVEVKLIGNDGNAFAILGAVQRALRENGVSSEDIAEFQSEATASDYNHLLVTVQRWVEVV